MCLKSKNRLMTFLSPAVSYNQNWVVRVERYMIQLRLFSWDYWLGTNGMIFVDMKIKYMDLAVPSNRGKHGTRIRRPSNISHLWIQVKHEKRFTGRKYNFLVVNALSGTKIPHCYLWNVCKSLTCSYDPIFWSSIPQRMWEILPDSTDSKQCCKLGCYEPCKFEEI